MQNPLRRVAQQASLMLLLTALIGSSGSGADRDVRPVRVDPGDAGSDE